jgi:hypothetical protein
MSETQQTLSLSSFPFFIAFSFHLLDDFASAEQEKWSRECDENVSGKQSEPGGQSEHSRLGIVDS